MPGTVMVPFGSTFVRRIVPVAAPQHYKTYGIAQPLKTHWRPATCEEAGCDAYRNGWVTTIDLETDLGQRQYDYCKRDKTRSFTEQRASLTLLKLVYKPGSRCFRSADHRLPLERPARLYVAEGDWRGNPRGIPVRVHSRAEDWVEDFSEHQDRLATAIGRG